MGPAYPTPGVVSSADGSVGPTPARGRRLPEAEAEDSEPLRREAVSQRSGRTGWAAAAGVLISDGLPATGGQAVAIWWVWSLSRLWDAITSRHSARQAANPRRANRSIRRLCLICPKIGSIMDLRCL